MEFSLKIFRNVASDEATGIETAPIDSMRMGWIEAVRGGGGKEVGGG